jgi:CheY-like chemotaxis protein
MIIAKKAQPQGDVLIVDFDPESSAKIKTYCENLGCFRNILITHDGSSASSKLRNQKFALIVLELNMPKKSGLDVLREMNDRSLNSKNNVIVISETLNQTMVEKITVSGVKSYLPKPFSEEDIRNKILKLLALK